MTAEQWSLLAASIEALWPSTPFSEASEQAYFHVLKDFEYETVDAAIRRHLEEGGAFPPSAAQILAACRDVGSAGEASPTEALNLVLKAMRRWPSKVYRRTALHWLMTKSEVVAAWAVEVWDQLAREPIDDPDRGGMIRVRYEKSYAAFAERVREEERNTAAVIEATERPLLGPRKMDAARQIEGAGLTLPRGES